MRPLLAMLDFVPKKAENVWQRYVPWQEVRALKTLRMARTDAGLTISELAKRAGVSRDTISNAEKGRHGLQAATLNKLARALGRTPSELLAEEERLAPKATRRSPFEPTFNDVLAEERREDEEHRRRTYLIATLRELSKCADDTEGLAREFAENLSVGAANRSQVAERVGRLVQLAEEVHRRATTAEWLFSQLLHLTYLPDWERELVAEIQEQYARLYAALSAAVHRIDAEERMRDVLVEVVSEAERQQLEELVAAAPDAGEPG